MAKGFIKAHDYYNLANRDYQLYPILINLDKVCVIYDRSNENTPYNTEFLLDNGKIISVIEDLKLLMEKEKIYL